MAFRKNTDEGGRGRQKYTGERREGTDRAKGSGLRGPRSDRGSKPYAYGDDKPRREKTSKLMAPASVQLEEKEPDELPFLIYGRNAVKEAMEDGASMTEAAQKTYEAIKDTPAEPVPEEVPSPVPPVDPDDDDII